MKAILRPVSLFGGMYLVSAACIAIATGDLETGAITALATAGLKFLVAQAHHTVWDRIDHGRVPVATPWECPVCSLEQLRD